MGQPLAKNESKEKAKKPAEKCAKCACQRADQSEASFCVPGCNDKIECQNAFTFAFLATSLTLTDKKAT